MLRRLLVVVTSEVADGALRDLVRSRAGVDAEMLVVAPASEISRLDWLTQALRTTPVPTRPRLRPRQQRPPRSRTSRRASATPIR
jgi:hypothetical protein